MQSSSNLILSPALVLALFSVCIGIAATVTNYWSYEVWILYFKVYRLNNGLWKRCNLRYPVHPPGTYIEKCIDRFVEGRLKNLEFRQVITWDHLTHNATWEVVIITLMAISVICNMLILLLALPLWCRKAYPFSFGSVIALFGFICSITAVSMYSYHFFHQHVADAETGNVDSRASRSKLGWSFWLAVVQTSFQGISAIVLLLLVAKHRRERVFRIRGIHKTSL
ncbi:hypothetical protein T11_2206 [Trichinella zimbabwensis]|uniref:Transmembrane protein n=2 Tax=Trichinella TaxID=6333 RepID=A0A0V1H1M8_9BILA